MGDALLDAHLKEMSGEIPMAKKFSQLLAQMPPERLARIEAETEAMLQEIALADSREATAMPQTELDRNIGIKQPRAADMGKPADM